MHKMFNERIPVTARISFAFDEMCSNNGENGGKTANNEEWLHKFETTIESE